MFTNFIQNTQNRFKTIKNSPFFDKAPRLPKTPPNEQDLEYMNSLSAAVLQKTSFKLHNMIVIFAVTIFLFIVWAYFAKIDEIARGNGKVVPSGQNQLIQNLEGGIVSEILVKEGDYVERNQTLIKISNEKSSSSAASHTLKLLALEAQILRLEAELSKDSFTYDLYEIPEMNMFLENEKELFEANKKQLQSKIQILKEQLSQKRSDLKDAEQTKKHLEFSVGAIVQEVEMTKPMVERGIRSQVDFLKLQREESEAKQRLQSSILSIPKLKSEIYEIEKKIEETKESYISDVRSKLNEVVSSHKELEATTSAYEDQVSRTIVKSPSNGIVQKLHINTIGGSIKPAQDLIEIVPTDYKLLVEVKILPSDIAFIYQGQKAIVKFSAYDFSIYGGLDGHVVNISPDTITEKDDKTYYLVRIETDKNYIGTEEQPMKIIPGMVANVDIITGKKSILDYILKPILKTKQYTFTER